MLAPRLSLELQLVSCWGEEQKTTLSIWPLPYSLFPDPPIAGQHQRPRLDSYLIWPRTATPVLCVSCCTGESRCRELYLPNPLLMSYCFPSLVSSDGRKINGAFLLMACKQMQKREHLGPPLSLALCFPLNLSRVCLAAPMTPERLCQASDPDHTPAAAFTASFCFQNRLCQGQRKKENGWSFRSADNKSMQDSWEVDLQNHSALEQQAEEQESSSWHWSHLITY